MSFLEKIRRKMRYSGCRNYSDTPLDVILVAGQSNADGYGTGDPELRFVPDPQILMWDFRKGVIIADEHYRAGNLSSSFYLYFAEQYIDRYMLDEGRKILIVNTAVGGTGFKGKRWGTEDDLYKRMINTVEEVNSVFSDVRWKCMLWHQGETDVTDGADYDFYHDKFKALVDGVRKCLPDIPFIAGDMVEEWKKEQPRAQLISDAVQDVLKRLEGTAYVDTSGLKGNEYPDIIHFCRKSNISLAQRYLDAYECITGVKKQQK